MELNPFAAPRPLIVSLPSGEPGEAGWLIAQGRQDVATSCLYFTGVASTNFHSATSQNSTSLYVPLNTFSNKDHKNMWVVALGNDVKSQM